MMSRRGNSLPLGNGRWNVEKPEKAEKAERRDKRTETRKREAEPTAQEKCRAVLAVWTETRRPGEVCREMGVSWGLLKAWQGRAMEGMLLALQPRVASVEKTMALSHRVAVLLERKSKGMAMKGLEQRLARLQRVPAKVSGDSGQDGAEKKG